MRRAVLTLAFPAFACGLLGTPLAACGDDAPPAAAPGADGGASLIDSGPPPPLAKGDPCRGAVLPEDKHYVAPGLCARRIATGIETLRQIAFAPNGDLFGQSTTGKIWLLRDANEDGVYSKDEIHEWGTTGGNGNNVHLDIAGGFLYAGSTDGVERFAYTPGALTGGAGQEVVKVPPGGHSFHTVHIYDGYLYVHSGSLGNISHAAGTDSVDYDTERSLIKRFPLSRIGGGSALEWNTGEVVATGLRNASGYRRNEATGKIYAVVNGLDHARYGPAVSGPNENVHLDNPGEQVVEVAVGKRYGYPFCFTAQRVFSNGLSGTLFTAGTQLRTVFDEGENHPSHTDAWCAENSSIPTTFVQAHSAPMDIVFFDRQPQGALPEEYRGGAFISLHGSWNRETSPTGFRVVWQPFNPDGTAPQPISTNDTTTFPYKVILGGGSAAGHVDGRWGIEADGIKDGLFRPVGVEISPLDGALYISTDDGGMLYRVGSRKRP